jgi:nuclease HARBI1
VRAFLHHSPTTDCAGPYPGRDHDKKIADVSHLNERLSRFCRTEYGDYAIYGDPAYEDEEFIFSPFNRAVLTLQEAVSNTIMSSARVSVEHAIGQVVTTFPALDFVRTARAKQTHVGIKYLVSVILRNFLTCIRGTNQICEFFDCPPPSLEEFLHPRPERPIRLVEMGFFTV